MTNPAHRLSRAGQTLLPRRSQRLTRQLLRRSRNALFQEIAASHTRGRRRPAPVVEPARPDTMIGAFYVIWQRSGLYSLRLNADRLTDLFPEWLHLDRAGTALDFKDWDPEVTQANLDVVDVAREHHIDIHPVLNNAEAGQFDPVRAHVLLASARNEMALAREVRDWLVKEEFQGLNLDLENLRPDDYARLPGFVALLEGVLHPAGLQLSVDIEAGKARPAARADRGRGRLRHPDELRPARGRREPGPDRRGALVRQRAGPDDAARPGVQAGGRRRQLRPRLARRRQAADGADLPAGPVHGAGQPPRRPAAAGGGLRPRGAQPDLQLRGRFGPHPRGVDAGRGDRVRRRAAGPSQRDQRRRAVGARGRGPVAVDVLRPAHGGLAAPRPRDRHHPAAVLADQDGDRRRAGGGLLAARRAAHHRRGFRRRRDHRRGVPAVPLAVRDPALRLQAQEAGADLRRRAGPGVHARDPRRAEGARREGHVLPDRRERGALPGGDPAHPARGQRDRQPHVHPSQHGRGEPPPRAARVQHHPARARGGARPLDHPVPLPLQRRPGAEHQRGNRPGAGGLAARLHHRRRADRSAGLEPVQDRQRREPDGAHRRRHRGLGALAGGQHQGQRHPAPQRRRQPGRDRARPARAGAPPAGRGLRVHHHRAAHRRAARGGDADGEPARRAAGGSRPHQLRHRVQLRDRARHHVHLRGRARHRAGGVHHPGGAAGAAAGAARGVRPRVPAVGQRADRRLQRAARHRPHHPQRAGQRLSGPRGHRHRRRLRRRHRRRGRPRVRRRSPGSA